MTKEFMTSGLTGKEYCPNDVIRIVNVYQATLYWTFGLEPLEIYPSRDFKTGKPILVFLFDKEKSQELYKKWCNFELK